MSQCQGITSQGNQCKRNATIGNYCASHQDQAKPLPQIVLNPQNLSIPSPELHTVMPEIQTTTIDMPHDRMMRYRKSPSCPKCNAHPVVCKARRQDYAFFRCRECGYRWEVNRRVG